MDELGRWTFLSDDLVFKDGTYRVVEYQRRSVKLRNIENGTYRNMAASEIRRHLLDPASLNISWMMDLDRVPKKAREEAMFWAKWIEKIDAEIGYGVPTTDDDGSRPDGPRPSLNHVIEETVAQLEALGRVVSASSLKRKRLAFHASDVLGLLDRRSIRYESPLGRADPRLLKAFRRAMKAEINESTGTGSRLFERIAEDLERRFPKEKDLIPSEATMYRYLKLLEPYKYPTRSAKNRRSAASSPQRAYRHRYHDRPGQEVQMDNSKFAILVRDEDGKPVRVVLCIMVDTATRTICGFGIRLKATKGEDLIIILAGCLVPRPNRPTQRPPSGEITPADLDLEISDRRAQAEVPYIVPELLVIDNGRDFRSFTFESACKYFGMSIAYCPPYTPSAKGIVERAFKTMETRLAQYLPGYLGRDPTNRGVGMEKKKLLDIPTLYSIIEDWIVNDYQRRPHKGLRDPLFPSQTLSPNEMFDAMSDVAGAIPISLTSDDYIELMPRVPAGRRIGRQGIQLGNIMYDSPRLGKMRLKPSPNKRTDYRWEVHYSPYDVSRVWVKNPKTGKWITCLRTDKDIWARPFSPRIYTLARQGRSKRNVNLEADIKESNSQLRLAAKRQAMTSRQWEKRRNLVKQQEEQSGIPLPTVPESDAGTSESSSPDLRQSAPRTRLGQFDPKEDPY